MGPRAGLDVRKISPPTGIRSPDRPARSSVAIPTELPGPQNIAILCVYTLRTHKRKKRLPSIHTHTKARLQLRYALRNTVQSLLHIYIRISEIERTYISQQSAWCDTKRRQLSELQSKMPDTCHNT